MSSSFVGSIGQGLKITRPAVLDIVSLKSPCLVIKTSHLEEFAHGISWKDFILSFMNLNNSLFYAPTRPSFQQERTSLTVTTCLQQSDKSGLGWSWNCENTGGSDGKSCARYLFYRAAKLARRLYTTSQHESGDKQSLLQRLCRNENQQLNARKLPRSRQ